MPIAKHRIYVGTIGEGIWRSLDGGDSFQRVCAGMFMECHVRALAAHPHEPRFLLAGTEDGLFCSGDGADSWSRVDSPLDGQQIWSLLISPLEPDLIVAGTCPADVFVSHDGGKNWNEIDLEAQLKCPGIVHTRVTTLKADPADADTLWMGIEIDGLRRSRDRGLTWERIGVGLSSQDIHDLVILRNRSSTRMLAAANNDLNISTDNGQTWNPMEVEKSLPWKYCRGLVVPCGQSECVLMGNGDGPPGHEGAVACSTDAGETWQTATMPSRSNSTIWNFAVHEAKPDLIYSSSVSGQIWRSEDQGISWGKLDWEFGEIRSLVWTPE